jgi:TolA-binding protein
MSLVFEALKKGHNPTAPVSAPVPAPAPEVVPVAAPAPTPAPVATSAPFAAGENRGLSGQVVALVAGMALAGGGAWLYWAGKASNNVPAPVPAAQIAIAPMAAPLPAPVLAPLPEPVAIAAPVAVVAPVAIVAHKPVPEASLALKAPEPRALVAPAKTASPVAPAAVPAAIVATAAVAVAPATSAPAAVAAAPEVKPVVRPLNTQVVVTIEPTPFDVREVFQSFVQLLQTGQLAEAQSAADKITGALGSNHVMSLRAQGYVSLKKNELGLARGHYLQLHQLLPEDREAALNLALIEWRQGNKEAAAKRVARLLEKYPGDAELQALHLNVRTP